MKIPREKEEVREYSGRISRAHNQDVSTLGVGASSHLPECESNLVGLPLEVVHEAEAGHPGPGEAGGSPVLTDHVGVEGKVLVGDDGVLVLCKKERAAGG
jgi:hypothetical protein